MKIKRQITLDKTHIADDIQMYAEILVTGFGYNESTLAEKLFENECKLFDQLLIQNLFNTTLEYSQYSNDSIANCHRLQRQLCNKLRMFVTEEMAPVFAKRASIYDGVMLDNITTTKDMVNGYVNEFDIDRCGTLKEIAHDIHLQLEVN